MAIYKRGNVWWMDVYQGTNRRRVRRSTGTSDEVQARIIEQAAIAVNRGITTRQRAVAIIDNLLPVDEAGVKIGDAATYYLECIRDEDRELSQHERNHRKSALGQFATWAKTCTRAVFVSDVDSHVAFGYTKYLNEKDLSVRSKNAYVGTLITIWKMFVKRGKAVDNPWLNCRYQRRAAEERTGRAFTPDEIERLRKVCREVGHDWEGAMMVALYTGLRLFDSCNLKWEEVDLATATITRTPSKTRKHGVVVRIPIHAKLLEVLTAQRHDGEYVFPARCGKTINRKYTHGDVPFNEIIQRAGIVDADHKLSFHCLRHTFVSRLAEAGVAEDVRMRLAGHTSAVTHAIYTHDDVSGRAAIEKLK